MQESFQRSRGSQCSCSVGGTVNHVLVHKYVCALCVCNFVSYTLQPEQLIMHRCIDKDTFEQNGSHSYAPQI